MSLKWHSTRDYQWRRKPVKIDWKLVLAGMVAILLIVLAVSIFVVGVVRAEPPEGLPGCQSIKAVLVPPQAVVKQPDGDTFHIFTFDVPSVVKIRVKDAETPERNQEGFEEAKAFTREWLNRGPFRVITCGEPTLDRVVGIVTRDGKTLADELKAAGYWRWQH